MRTFVYTSLGPQKTMYRAFASINKEIPMNTVRRLSYFFLCIVPFLCFVVVGVRAFRSPGVYQAVGVTYFAAIAMAAWTLSAGAIRAAVQRRRFLGLAGTLLITPFALVALLWVGLGGPWQANRQRTRCGILSSLLW